ncbi:DNA polymerase III subunit beta [Patescibacteria group bacterium]|nr:DNA polymerase III subunit beta [Patescibacteria group bacterium]MCL5010190.1 DNA polymerase III subunit beta [Patescibacteria group bacterium]
MKTTFILQDIQKSIPFLNHALSSRSVMPILTNVLIETKGNELRMSTTDLEIGAEIKIQTRGEIDGKALLPARPLFELLGFLPGTKSATMQIQEKSLVLTTDRTKSVFQTQNPDEFPNLYEKKGKKITVLTEETIQKELAKVVFASSADSSRPALSGVLVKTQDSGITLAATDGFRLSLKKIKAASEGQGDKGIIVPSRVFREVLMFKDGGDVSVFVSNETNQIIFSQEGRTLVGKLIDSKFPDYEKIIPADAETRITLDRDELQKAVKASAIFAREANGMIRFSIRKEWVEISANTPSIGENRVEVEARTEGEENEIAFNPRYVLELLSNIDEEEIVFEMTGPLNPGVFKIKDDPTFLHLIMPIRVQG